MSLKDIPTDNSLKLYELNFEYRPQYLYVFVAGEKDSYEISMAYWQEIAEECKKSNTRKVLIEEDLVEAITMNETYRLASQLPLMGFYGVRIAFVDLRDEQNNLNQFGETVANNRGLHCRVFNNAEDAEKWLLSE